MHVHESCSADCCGFEIKQDVGRFVQFLLTQHWTLYPASLAAVSCLLPAAFMIAVMKVEKRACLRTRQAINSKLHPSLLTCAFKDQVEKIIDQKSKSYLYPTLSFYYLVLWHLVQCFASKYLQPLRASGCLLTGFYNAPSSSFFFFKLSMLFSGLILRPQETGIFCLGWLQDGQSQNGEAEGGTQHRSSWMLYTGTQAVNLTTRVV